MLTRHSNRVHTPGASLGKPEIKRDDPQIREDYNQIQARRSELVGRLNVVNGKIEQIKINLGAWVAEGCDWKEYTDQLAELRAEVEAVQAGIDYLAGQADLIKRVNSWL